MMLKKPVPTGFFCFRNITGQYKDYLALLVNLKIVIH